MGNINCDMKKDVLESKLLNILEERVNDTDLMKMLINSFSEKGIPTRLIPQLFDDNLELEDLTKIQLICLVDGLHKYFKTDSLNPDKYFSNNSKSEYLNHENKETVLDTLDFNYFRKINDLFFVGALTYKQIYCYMRDGLITYEKESQRKAKYIKTPKGGSYRRKIAINKKSVREIADLMLQGNFFDTEIILNCQVIKGKKSQQVEYKEIVENSIYNIEVTPNYDLSSDTTTVVNLNDGGHRVAGIILATDMYKEKYGQDTWLEGIVPVQLRFMTLSSASQLVAQIFKRSDVGDKNWQRSVEENDYTKFSDLIINQCYLKNKVGKLFEDTFVNKNIITYKLVLSDTVKKLGIDVGNKSVMLIDSKEIAEKMDMIYNLIDEEKYNKLYSHKNDINIPIIYLTIAFLLKDESIIDIETYRKILEQLEILDEKEYKELKLNNKNYNIDNLVSFTKNIISKIQG